MSKYKCDDCKDTKLIEVESVVMSRSYYGKEHKCMVYDTVGKNDWHTAQCHCVGEIE